jgi:hypothetical protein
LFQSALSLHHAGKFDEAERLYRRSIFKAPKAPWTRHNLANVFRSQGPIGASAVVVRLRHLATVLGFRP